MQHFYDGQIRRYITQLVRLFSNFSYQDGDGKIIRVPVMYGDITRQVGHILRDNHKKQNTKCSSYGSLYYRIRTR